MIAACSGSKSDEPGASTSEAGTDGRVEESGRDASVTESEADAPFVDVLAPSLDASTPDVDALATSPDAPALEAAADSASDGPTADAPAVDGPAEALPLDAADLCARAGLDSFKISNLSADYQLPHTQRRRRCHQSAGFRYLDSGAFSGGGPHATAPAGSALDSPRVLYVNDFTLSAASEFVITGSRPLIIVARGTVEIAGTDPYAPEQHDQRGRRKCLPDQSGNLWLGRWMSHQWSRTRRRRPRNAIGRRRRRRGLSAASGAEARAVEQKASSTAILEIIPLLGGSSGGSASYSNLPSGPGGGAVQIVAGTAIVIKLGGVITMAGAGGYSGATGAGSGGSILLEAPKVTVDGVVAANGGGGGGSSGSGAVAIGDWGGITSTPARGGGPPGEKAGNGSGGVTIDGADGEPSMYGTGGGGGAGRIRINTACGAVTVGASAVMSPGQSTACASIRHPRQAAVEDSPLRHTRLERLALLCALARVVENLNHARGEIGRDDQRLALEKMLVDVRVELVSFALLGVRGGHHRLALLVFGVDRRVFPVPGDGAPGSGDANALLPAMATSLAVWEAMARSPKRTIASTSSSLVLLVHTSFTRNPLISVMG